MVTAAEIPDLFGVEERPPQLYELLIAQLMFADRHREIVEVCRIVRQYAIAADIKHPTELFTSIEIDTLCLLGALEEAITLADASLAYWREIHPEIELAARFIHERGPILYQLGRHEESADAFEGAIRLYLDRTTSSYDLVGVVYCPDPPAAFIQQISLNEPYTALGKSLTEWRDWDRFIDLLDDALFVLAKIDREMLRADPTLLGKFERRLSAIAHARGSGRSGVTRGGDDLLEPESDVRAEHEKIARDRATHSKSSRAQRAETDAKLERYFGHVLHGG